VFNDESVYNAYKKRCLTLVKNNDAYSQQMQRIANKEEEVARVYILNFTGGVRAIGGSTESVGNGHQ
jgi:hypothetical protein